MKKPIFFIVLLTNLLIFVGCKHTEVVDTQNPEIQAEIVTSEVTKDVPLSLKWVLPDAPDGSKPDQCWLAVGSDPNGDIYISGHDHQTNSMLYRLDQNNYTLSWVGDAKQASMDADNWETGETAEKFHTRPLYFDDRIYVATLDKSSMDGAYLYSRGFHWYVYDKKTETFIDLSASEEGGVGAESFQIVTIQVDPNNGVIYGMSIPENKLVSYDITTGVTTVLGKPSAWVDEYFYSNRFMWVDSRGRLYITGGTERGQWNMGEDSDVFSKVWYYDPVEGFGETSFMLNGANALEVGQWDRTHERLYVSDDQGNIYRFTDETATWEYLGAPGFKNLYDVDFNANKVWVFNLSADEEKIYIGTSDNGFKKNDIWEFDITTGESAKLFNINDLDTTAGRRAFITGYDTWDNNGLFYLSAFSMNDFQNVILMGLNPVAIKVSNGLLNSLITVELTEGDDGFIISHNDSSQKELEVLYQFEWYNSDDLLLETTYGEIIIPEGVSETTLTNSAILDYSVTGASKVMVSIVPDGNDYIIADRVSRQLSID